MCACFSTGGIDNEADGGAVTPGLRAGARGLKLAAPFFFKRELMAQQCPFERRGSLLARVVRILSEVQLSLDVGCESRKYDLVYKAI